MTTKKQANDPPLRCHKATGQGYVHLDGRRIYLGVHGKPQTLQKYHQVLAEWHANGCRLPATKGGDTTVVELCAAYWDHAAEHYRKGDGSSSTTIHRVRQALRLLRDLYGPSSLADFGPLALRAVRQRWIDKGLARGTINEYVAQIKRAFKWGVSRQLVPETVYRALTTVAGLQAGRSAAKETEDTKPVPDAHVAGVEPFVNRQVWALIQLQLLTAARGGEVIMLRAVDFETSGKIWTATVCDHKKAYLGKQRTVYFGPRAQAIVRGFMADRPVDAYLFSPRDAERERHAQATAHRRPGQQKAPRKSRRVLGTHYTSASYRRCIERACVKAGVPVWTPHRLRHSAGTFIRQEFGIEAAQVMLGHASVGVTQVYAEVNRARALEVAAKIG